LVPEYSKLGQAIAADPKLKNRVLIAKVDADAHRELGELRARAAQKQTLMMAVNFKRTRALDWNDTCWWQLKLLAPRVS
jgi:hypothetical protein